LDTEVSGFGRDAAVALPGPDWLRAKRAAAAERFGDLDLPTEAEEIWRYSRIGDLDLDRYAPAMYDSTTTDPVAPQMRPVIEAVGTHAALVIVNNGSVAHSGANPELEERGLTIGDLRERDGGDELWGDVASSVTDAFTELNAAFAPGAVYVDIPAGMEIEDPIVVVHWIHGDGAAVFPHTVVRAGADSGATVVEYQMSEDVEALVDPVVELHVDRAARLRYLNVQDLGPRVWHIGYQASQVERDATLRSSTVALGGSYARTRTDSRIIGQGGTSYLTAVYFADGDRMHDFRTLQDHDAPSSTSDLLFKGAVQDTGRSVYSGLIRVRKDARGTNAFQTNRNLVLSEGAGAESVPNLEIETDDVRCSHASAVGPIDEEHRYYLESRGVPPDVAERLIVLGFFGEVLDQLPTPALVDTVRATVAERLAAKPR
jgi:Fe-S cluster assembly protein SufD